MDDRTKRETLRAAAARWEEETLKLLLEKAPERANEFSTVSHKAVERLYTPLDVPPGRYEIAVALRIDSPALDRYSGYQAQRRLVEESGSDSLMAAFFLPDEALELRLVDLSKGRLLVVRGYECELSRGEWYQLTALFLPDESVAVLLPYLPTPAAYGFKDDYVLAQLSYHDVPEFDRTHVVDALRRIGMVVYQYEKTKEYRCFRVALDGNLDSWVCVDRRAP